MREASDFLAYWTLPVRLKLSVAAGVGCRPALGAPSIPARPGDRGVACHLDRARFRQYQRHTPCTVQSTSFLEPSSLQLSAHGSPKKRGKEDGEGHHLRCRSRFPLPLSTPQEDLATCYLPTLQCVCVAGEKLGLFTSIPHVMFCLDGDVSGTYSSLHLKSRRLLVNPCTHRYQTSTNLCWIGTSNREWTGRSPQSRPVIE